MRNKKPCSIFLRSSIVYIYGTAATARARQQQSNERIKHNKKQKKRLASNKILIIIINVKRHQQQRQQQRRWWRQRAKQNKKIGSKKNWIIFLYIRELPMLRSRVCFAHGFPFLLFLFRHTTGYTSNQCLEQVTMDIYFALSGNGVEWKSVSFTEFWTLKSHFINEYVYVSIRYVALHAVVYRYTRWNN